MTVLIYQYTDQGLFITEKEARINPRNSDTVIVPAQATLIAPMELTESYTIQQFILDSKSWSIIPDYRNYHYFTLAGGEAMIEDVNITPPADAVEMVGDDHLMQDDNGMWRLMTQEDDLNAIKVIKIWALKHAFTLSLNEEGLNSSALGAEHRYDAQQQHIDWVLACVLLTLTSAEETPLITCDDLLGNENSKRPLSHDKDQCATLLLDGMILIQDMKDKLAGLETDVDKAADEAAVDRVVW